jgi:serine phosphatase RsbU (regulator of sigma subunit)/pSer/pThr/pTyr-binding forkhead associated (FHA) protein
MAVLRALRGVNPGQLFPVEGEVSTLGRHPQSTIVLDAPAVSRHHARIVHQGQNYYIEDLNSRNGTFVNGELVTERQLIAESDEIQICDLAFIFHHGTPDPSSPLPQGGEQATVLAEDGPTDGSAIMSKIAVSSGSSSMLVQMNAEAKLRALLEIGQSLGKAIGLDEVLAKILDSLFVIFPQADRGFIVLKSAETSRLIIKATKYRRHGDSQTPRISGTIINGVIKGKEAILSADAATDARFGMAESVIDFHIRSMMCAPLVGTDGNALGALQIDTLDQRSRFNPGDLEVLASVACQAASAVENAQLHEAALRERAIERDLALAHEVQQGFLPAVAPTIEGYEFFEYYEPAHKLGGDYYDYIQLPEGRMGVVVADVSGKGIAASLLMARLSAETRYCLVSERTPAAAVARLNRVFCDRSWEGRFVTFVLSVLDPVRHEVTVVNAGHLPPLLRRYDGTVESVAEEETKYPLGVDSDVEYCPITLPIAPGDSLVLYTDGITEAMNGRQELYGRSRLSAKVGNRADSVRALGQNILENVKEFVGKRAQSDDMCLTCFGRLIEDAEIRQTALDEKTIA